MTPLQMKVYKFIEDFWKKNEYAPTYRQIAEGCETRVGSAHRSCQILIEEGLLVHSPGRWRSVRPSNLEWPPKDDRST